MTDALPPGFAAALAWRSQPERMFAWTAARYLEQVGYAMLTMTLHDKVQSRARRIYSSSPDTHPISAFKSVLSTDWVAQVIDRHEVFVGNTVAEFRDAYTDSAALERMGLRSACNFPIVIAGRALGSVNLTASDEGFYNPERLARGVELAAYAAVGILLSDAPISA